MSGLLAVCDGDEHARVVLADDKLLRDRTVHAGLDERQPLLFTHGQIVAFINAARREKLRQNGDQLRLPPLQPQTGDLERQAVRKFIDRQPRQSVGLAEDDAAGIGKAQCLPHAPRRLDPAGKKCTVDGLGFIPRQDADSQPGFRIEKTARGKVLAAVQHIDDAAVRADIVRPVELVVIDQSLPLPDAGFLAAPQADLRIFHTFYTSSA